ncbi:MAG TPA: Crp/Fnr family transcriptional regulator [Flavisolibacter sp.]|jgi:CRP/FNR family transcriptional regulator|nr:Crp/Fnr family transcriptional regulator [Flavisolibacter sp.]
MAFKDCDLQQCFLCRHCHIEWKELIVLKKRTQVFRKGRTIFQEGDRVEGLFFLYEGAVKVSQTWGAEKELIIRFAGPGDVLGHRGFGSAHIYPITATALEDSQVCYIDTPFLEASLKVNPQLTYGLLDLYASELQKAERRMRDLAHRDGRGRILLALLEAEQSFGVDEQGFVRLPLTRQDIASYAGTSYETVFKVFSEWVAAGWINFSGKTFQIRDRNTFQQLLKETSIPS